MTITLVWTLAAALLLAFTANGDESVALDFAPTSKEAYVTLLYGDSFLLGVRVLGQSIRETKTSRDFVVIVAGPLSKEGERTLLQDGMKVHHAPVIRNPGKGPQPGRGYPAKFWAVYTKLLIFKLVQYQKVVYLDADVIVMRNMDALFKCPGFCAALRHSERFNTGVLSLTPSDKLFENMMQHIKDTPSYTGGDQGFMNSFFTGFADSLLFDPDKDYVQNSSQYMRLPTTFNADIGLYVVNSNRWALPRTSIYVMHFTLGNFKPWVWWTDWLIRETPTWAALRSRLPPDSAGRPAGCTARQLLAERWLVFIPLLLLAAILWRQRGVLPDVWMQLGPQSGGPRCLLPVAVSGGLEGWLGLRGALGSHGVPCKDCLPTTFIVMSIIAGYLCVAVAALIAILAVPPEVTVLWGWVLSYEWGFIIFGIAFGRYLYQCYIWGRQSVQGYTATARAAPLYPRPWFETIVAAALVAAMMLLAPWIGRMLHITTFVGNIVATVFIVLFANLTLTVQFLILPAKWLTCGRLEASAK